VTVLDSSPAPTAVPENDDGGFSRLTANGRRVLIVSAPSALFAEMTLAVMLSPGVRPALMHKRARGWRDRAKRPDLTVMAHTADHLPRHVGACSFRVAIHVG
jgi:hypothetical protein